MLGGTEPVEIVEVGPRDGYQAIGPFIATTRKIDILRRLAEAGVERIEVGAFVSETAVPQMRDAVEILAACRDLPSVVPQVLVPNERYAAKALAAGAKFLVFVLSASDAHNMSNVRRSTRESAESYRRLMQDLPADVDMRLNIATSFDCPFDGPVDPSKTLALLDELIPLRPDAEICLCDTTGKVSPAAVDALFRACLDRFPVIGRWAYHAHDTYGMGLAGVFAAWTRGIRVFDASVAGLGGCPFAPGATGNVATEDLVWMFRRMGVDLPIDLDRLLGIACDAATIPGGLPGGRARQALAARSVSTANSTG